jgi:hypothetical protein
MEIWGRLKTKLHDKHDDHIFPKVNFPFISNNVPVVLAYITFAPHILFKGLFPVHWFSRQISTVDVKATQTSLQPPRLKSFSHLFYDHHLERALRNIHSQMAMNLLTFYLTVYLYSITEQTWTVLLVFYIVFFWVLFVVALCFVLKVAFVSGLALKFTLSFI